jgi:hypothetical protein
MEIRWERLSGYPRPTSQMSAIQFAAVVNIEALFEREERRIRLQVKQAIFAFVGAKEK